jgi:hypothetical protein
MVMGHGRSKRAWPTNDTAQSNPNNQTNQQGSKTQMGKKDKETATEVESVDLTFTGLSLEEAAAVIAILNGGTVEVGEEGVEEGQGRRR